jgi:hypothetical protein
MLKDSSIAAVSYGLLLVLGVEASKFLRGEKNGQHTNLTVPD